jgi:hypothetical protein
MQRNALLGITAGLVLVAAACADASSSSLAEPDPTTPWWVLVVVGAALAGILGSLVWRGSVRHRPAAADQVRWKNDLREAYLGGRWLHDSMTDDLAVWRGKADHQHRDSTDENVSDRKSELSVAVGKRSEATLNSLYALEAAAPDRRTADNATATAMAIRAVSDSLDARAEARFRYLDAADDVQARAEARDREVRSSTILSETRAELSRCVTRLGERL